MLTVCGFRTEPAKSIKRCSANAWQLEDLSVGECLRILDVVNISRKECVHKSVPKQASATKHRRFALIPATARLGFFWIDSNISDAKTSPCRLGKHPRQKVKAPAQFFVLAIDGADVLSQVVGDTV